MLNLGLYFIINESSSQDGIITDVNNAIAAGVRVIHYSEKRLRKSQIVENAYVLAALCKKNNVLFIIEDYPDIAALVGADGVHLTQQDFSIEHVRSMLGQEKYIGMQFTCLRDAVHAEEKGADYLCIGCSSRTGEKLSTKAIINTIKKMKELLTIPIIATGEFSLPDVQALLDIGIGGVALRSHLYKGDELQQNIRQVLALMQ